MRNLSGNVLRTIGAAALMAIAGASVARADEQIVARVPFDFTVGDLPMPAGAYVVANVSNDSSVMSIASADGRHFAFTMTIPLSSIQTPAQPELVFEKVENHYVLARIDPAVGIEREIVPAHANVKHEATTEYTEIGFSR